jgi:two-component system nitrate/nitrite response regulator NarL
MEVLNTRIALLHRDGIYRESLTRCLAQAEAISIVYSSSRFDELTQFVVIANPDLLIVEFGLCQAQQSVGSERLCACSGVFKTIMIGVPDRDNDILACIEREGASGYLLMDASLDDLLTNIRAVMKGEALCSPRIAGLAFDRVSTLARQVDRVPTVNGNMLTRRETEIIKLIDDGLSNKEIAVRLHIEVSTVKNHVHNILDKLHLRNRYSAVKYAKAQGLTLTRA